MTTPEAPVLESVLDELKSSDNETVIAQWGISQGTYGPLATYVEFSKEVDEVLRHNSMFAHSRGQAFYSHRTLAIKAYGFSRHEQLGAFAWRLGYEAHTDPFSVIQRWATLPTAEYINNYMDERPEYIGRMRFFTPVLGHISGEAYITQLADGLAPLPSPDKYWYSHDIDHVPGYALLGKWIVNRIRNHAAIIVENGIEIGDDGKLVPGSRSAKFADAVDDLSDRLARPLRTGEKHSLIKAYGGKSAARILADKPVSELSDHLRVKGFAAAIKIQHDVKKEFAEAA